MSLRLKRDSESFKNSFSDSDHHNEDPKRNKESDSNLELINQLKLLRQRYFAGHEEEAQKQLLSSKEFYDSESSTKKQIPAIYEAEFKGEIGGISESEPVYLDRISFRIAVKTKIHKSL